MWAERFLEWNDFKTQANGADLIDFPRRKEFIRPDHDFNRRVWRSEENRSMIYYAFEERGLTIMDLHYCLDFLKEETSPQMVNQRIKIIESLYSGFRPDNFEIYPKVEELARNLAIKVKTLNIYRKAFKFVLVNFREILTDIISECEYEPKMLEDWNDNIFNRILDEVELIGN